MLEPTIAPLTPEIDCCLCCKSERILEIVGGWEDAEDEKGIVFADAWSTWYCTECTKFVTIFLSELDKNIFHDRVFDPTNPYFPSRERFESKLEAAPNDCR